MASLAQSAVTIIESWRELGLGGKQIKVRKATVALTGQGGTTNTIPASLFDMTTIYDCSSLVLSDNSLMITAAPSADGTILLLKAAGTNAPSDNATNGTYTLTIKGI